VSVPPPNSNLESNVKDILQVTDTRLKAVNYYITPTLLTIHQSLLGQGALHSQPQPELELTISSTFIQTHSRRSSTLGQAVPVKDSVSVSRGNVGAIKQG
jgi:hypothetical protein